MQRGVSYEARVQNHKCRVLKIHSSLNRTPTPFPPLAMRTIPGLPLVKLHPAGKQTIADIGKGLD